MCTRKIASVLLAPNPSSINCLPIFQKMAQPLSLLLPHKYITFFLLSLSLSLCLSSSAQSHDTLWKLLLRTPGKPTHIMNHQSNRGGDFLDTTLDQPVYAAPLKVGNDLFLWFEGTGRLYQMKSDTPNGTFRRIRIDSTKYVGYNYEAFPFVHQGKIYNIGGYGYWKRNGHLRFFNQKNHQWDVVALNLEVPVIFYNFGDYLFYDASNGLIYLAGHLQLNDGLKQRTELIEKVMRLDLQKMEWSELGNLSPYLKQTRLQTVTKVAMGSQGLLLRMAYSDFKLLSFENNKIYKVNERIIDHFSFSKGKFDPFINFFIDSTLYSYNTTNGKVDSMTIHSADLTEIDQPIYTKSFHWDQYTYLTLALLLVPVFAFRKRLRSVFRTAVPPSANSKALPLSERIQLDALEDEVLQLVYRNTLKGKNTSIDEINAILGLSKRSADVQKKLRSDCIQSINRKLGIRWGIADPVIDKTRAEFDKRSFEYFILKELIPRIQELSSVPPRK